MKGEMTGEVKLLCKETVLLEGGELAQWAQQLVQTF